MYVLDTNIISNLMMASPSSRLEEMIRSVPPTDLFTTSVNLGELIYGARKKQSERLLRKIEELIGEMFPVLPFDEEAATRYGEIRVELEASGTPIGEADTRIAAIALARDLDVVTRNIRHFEKVPNLTVHDWL